MIRCANECAEVHSNICCYDCEKNKQCSDPCEMPMSECNDLIIENEADGLKVFALAQDDLVSELLEVVRDKKSLEEEEKKLKKEIKKFMEKCSIRKYKGQGVDINYIEGTTSKGIDSKKLKEKYPEIAEECVKEISKDSYIKVVVKK
ncbi:MAG: hypothetical protein PHX62_05740 [Bacilli bacterium]|nr:hypothetical protein [Bacilli bacterium]